MKKIIVLSMLLVAFTVKAQDNTSGEKLAVELIKLTGSTNMFDTAIKEMGSKVYAEKRAAYTKEAEATLDDLYAKIAKIYIEEFSNEELNKLLAFYKSDLGKKLASKQTIISRKGLVLGVAWGHDIQEIAEKYSPKKQENN